MDGGPELAGLKVEKREGSNASTRSLPGADRVIVVGLPRPRSLSPGANMRSGSGMRTRGLGRPEAATGAGPDEAGLSKMERINLLKTPFRVAVTGPGRVASSDTSSAQPISTFGNRKMSVSQRSSCFLDPGKSLPSSVIRRHWRASHCRSSDRFSSNGGLQYAGLGSSFGMASSVVPQIPRQKLTTFRLDKAEKELLAAEREIQKPVFAKASKHSPKETVKTSDSVLTEQAVKNMTLMQSFKCSCGLPTVKYQYDHKRKMYREYFRYLNITDEMIRVFESVELCEECFCPILKTQDLKRTFGDMCPEATLCSFSSKSEIQRESEGVRHGEACRTVGLEINGGRNPRPEHMHSDGKLSAEKEGGLLKAKAQSVKSGSGYWEQNAQNPEQNGCKPTPNENGKFLKSHEKPKASKKLSSECVNGGDSIPKSENAVSVSNQSMSDSENSVWVPSQYHLNKKQTDAQEEAFKMMEHFEMEKASMDVNASPEFIPDGLADLSDPLANLKNPNSLKIDLISKMDLGKLGDKPTKDIGEMNQNSAGKDDKKGLNSDEIEKIFGSDSDRGEKISGDIYVELDDEVIQEDPVLDFGRINSGFVGFEDSAPNAGRLNGNGNVLAFGSKMGAVLELPRSGCGAGSVRQNGLQPIREKSGIDNDESEQLKQIFFKPNKEYFLVIFLLFCIDFEASSV